LKRTTPIWTTVVLFAVVLSSCGNDEQPASSTSGLESTHEAAQVPLAEVEQLLPLEPPEWPARLRSAAVEDSVLRVVVEVYADGCMTMERLEALIEPRKVVLRGVQVAHREICNAMTLPEAFIVDLPEAFPRSAALFESGSDAPIAASGGEPLLPRGFEAQHAAGGFVGRPVTPMLASVNAAGDSVFVMWVEEESVYCPEVTHAEARPDGEVIRISLERHESDGCSTAELYADLARTAEKTRANEMGEFIYFAPQFIYEVELPYPVPAGEEVTFIDDHTGAPIPPGHRARRSADAGALGTVFFEAA